MGLDIYAGIRRFSQSIDEAKERLRMARASALSRTTAMVTRIALLRLYVAVYCKTVAVKVVQNTQISDTGGRVSISKGYSHPDYPDMDYSLVIGPIGMFMRACNGSFKAAAACGNITVQSDESHPVRNPVRIVTVTESDSDLLQVGRNPNTPLITRILPPDERPDNAYCMMADHIRSFGQR